VCQGNMVGMQCSSASFVLTTSGMLVQRTYVGHVDKVGERRWLAMRQVEGRSLMAPPMEPRLVARTYWRMSGVFEEVGLDLGDYETSKGQTVGH
jgi:hypothetical protein